MSVTNIFIARHGETEYNRSNRLQGRGVDILLNEKGRRQAKAIGDYLKGQPLDHIFSSSLRRSKQTAEIIAELFQKEYSCFSELDEMSFGYLEGRPAEEVEEDLEEIHNAWREGNVDYAPRDGESPSEVLQRVSSCTEILINQHQGSNILFILHGRLIRVLLSDWLKFGLSEMHRIKHTNGALYHLKWKNQKFQPVFLNSTEHLDGI